MLSSRGLYCIYIYDISNLRVKLTLCEARRKMKFYVGNSGFQNWAHYGRRQSVVFEYPFTIAV